MWGHHTFDAPSTYVWCPQLLARERAELGIVADGAGGRSGFERTLQPVQGAVPFAGAQVRARRDYRRVRALPERIAAARVQARGLVVAARQLDSGADAQAGRLSLRAIAFLEESGGFERGGH